MRTLGHQEETSSLTWVLLLFFLVLQEANNAAAKKKEATHRQTERERQESEAWQAGRQQRGEGRREAQLAAATKRERESANRAMVSGLCEGGVSGQTAEQRTRQAGYIPGARRASCVRLNG